MRTIIGAVFGPQTKVSLFGSRVDDARRGGDFDILVETDLDDPRELVRRKLDCLASLHATPEFEGEKIDLVITSLIPGSDQPIHSVARAEGAPL